MCNSLDRVAEELAESDLNGKCTKSENCVALDCSLSYLGIPISMNLILLPCEEPFGISVSVHSEILGGVIINGVYKNNTIINLYVLEQQAITEIHISQGNDFIDVQVKYVRICVSVHVCVYMCVYTCMCVSLIALDASPPQDC